MKFSIHLTSYGVLPQKTEIRNSSVRQMLNEHKTDSQKFPAAANATLAFTLEAEPPANCMRAARARRRGTDDWEGWEWSIMTSGPRCGHISQRGCCKFTCWLRKFPCLGARCCLTRLASLLEFAEKMGACFQDALRKSQCRCLEMQIFYADFMLIVVSEGRQEREGRKGVLSRPTQHSTGRGTL